MNGRQPVKHHTKNRLIGLSNESSRSELLMALIFVSRTISVPKNAFDGQSCIGKCRATKQFFNKLERGRIVNADMPRKRFRDSNHNLDVDRPKPRSCARLHVHSFVSRRDCGDSGQVSTSRLPIATKLLRSLALKDVKINPTIVVGLV